SKRNKKNRTEIYYCHPYCSSERGSNENQNKLIRRHIPKGIDFDDKTKKDVAEIESWMNNYPRKIFGFRTSQELFDEELAKIA
ncbi:MAG: IS30 family transposase, partial [Lachnospiraceae bacterium]|nr:IS30 family transposase [Lachnospiraceae bacterium]